MMQDKTFVRRLKERKLVQWALAYLAAAFVVFQSIEVLAEPWGIGPGIQRAIHVLLLIGLLVVLIVAWYHGESERQRVSGPELLMIAVLLGIAGLLVALLGPGAGGRPEEREPSAVSVSESARPSVAALPFEHWSGLEEDRWFTDGIHEQILTQLSKVGGLSVRGRTSAMEYRDSPKNLREIGQELNARYLLEGSVFREGETVRITVQLVDAQQDEHLWAESYDRDLSVESLLDVQSDIAQRVTHAMQAELTPAERARIEARPTDNLQAYNLYLLGQYHWNKFAQEDIEKAIGYYEQAIAADPSYALAHAGLGDAYLILALGHGIGAAEPSETIRRAEELGRRALELDEELSEAYVVLGMIKHAFDYEYAEAERMLRRAIELSPSNAGAHTRLGLLLCDLRRHDEAIATGRRAQELDPLAPIMSTDLARSLMAAGRFDEAVVETRAVIERAPDFRLGHLALCAALTFKGEYAEAIAACETARSMSGNPENLARLAAAHALAGNESEVRLIETQMREIARQRYVSPLEMGRLYEGVG
ncbi:MAG: tetratricopeptide repeat protein [Gemmatimonadota bacterium]|nr:MAG: tetratricopeptide repeat protein [Gemmatimonadota bacterium]